MNSKIKILIIALAIPLFIYLWPSFLGGSTDFLIVEGNSMLPTILPGSMVITKKQTAYEVDDIVAYHLEEGRRSKIVVHRIIEETPNGFVIQGDNNKDKDPGFYKNDKIIGEVVFATPHVGYVLLIIRNPVVMAITSVVLMIIQYELKRRKKRAAGHLLHQNKQQNTNFHTGVSAPPRAPKIKQPDYRLFFAASAVNIIVYIFQQFALANKKSLTGDFLTGILYSLLEDSIASTISFAAYFVILVTLYFLSKQREPHAGMGENLYSQRYVVKNRMLKGAQIIWLLFVLLGAFHLVTIIR